MHAALNAYASPTWKIIPRNALMDTAANTWCRTPGHVEYIGIAETVLDHVAVFLNKDPLQVRENNLAPGGDTGPNVVKDSILPLLKEKASIDIRKMEVQQFNQ
ncbi:Aldehyde oxidase/xanthine dehydrogenase molybdopterin binding, partial [Trinorchestia longiramus]